MEKQDQLPKMASDYIDAVIKKMRYCKKVRAEVRRELTDHFTDALADCKDENERNELAKELIAGFGDAKLLGVLLRRGKKRCRPLWRTMVVRLFQAVGVMFLLFLLYIGWFFAGKPVIATNYLEVANRLVRPVGDDNLNALPYYKQAAEKYVPHEDTEFDNSPRSVSILSHEQRELLIKWINDNRESLDLIFQGNQKPYYWPIYANKDNNEKELLKVIIPYLAEYKRLTYLLCWQALLAAEKGNYASAFDTTLEAYSFGRHLRGQHTTLIEQLVASSVEITSLRTIQILLNENVQTIDASLLDSTRKRLEVMIDNGNFAFNYDADKIGLDDEIQRSFTSSRLGGNHLYLNRIRQLNKYFGLGIALGPATTQGSASVLTSEMPPGKGGVALEIIKWGFHVLFTHPNQEQTIKTADRFFAEMNRLAQQTPATLYQEGIDIDKQGEKIAQGNLLIKMFVPSLRIAHQRSYQNQVQSCAILTILSLLNFQKLHNVYPDSLDALKQSGLLQKLPIDPFSDKPLGYKKTNNDFVLYSFGPNFTDDNGVPMRDDNGKPIGWAENGDWVFWPVAKD